MITDEIVTTEKEKDLFASLRKGGLSRDEKKKMKLFLTKELDLQKPIAMRGLALVWPVVYSKPAFGFGVVAMMALVGVGVGKASEGALPGDVLYKAKTSLYEPVEGALSQVDASEESKGRIKKRFIEAETLIKRGLFGEVEKNQIEALIEKELVIIETNGDAGIRENIVKEFADQSEYLSLTIDNERRMHIDVMPIKSKNEDHLGETSQQKEDVEKNSSEEDSEDKKDERKLLDVKGGEQEDDTKKEIEDREHSDKKENHRGSQDENQKTEDTKVESKDTDSHVENDGNSGNRGSKEDTEEEDTEKDDSDSSGSSHEIN